VTSDCVRQARTACELAFAFLVAEFGFRRDRARYENSGFLLRYRGSGTGVLVDWYPRDPLTVWLVRLVDGDFPARTMTVHPNSRMHYFDLGDVEEISGQPPAVPEDQLYALPDETTAQLVAESLRRCAGDLLRGDLTRIPLLEQRVRQRARDLTVARWGAERARTGLVTLRGRTSSG